MVLGGTNLPAGTLSNAKGSRGGIFGIGPVPSMLSRLDGSQSGVNVIKLFSLLLTLWLNKLENVCPQKTFALV